MPFDPDAPDEVTVEVIDDEPTHESAPEPQQRFVARFPTTTAGRAFCQAVAGPDVIFGEPPTRWEGSTWCVVGRAVARDALRPAAEAQGGAIRGR